MDAARRPSGEVGAYASLRAFEARLAELEPSRLREALAVIVGHLHEIMWTLRPTRDELRALVDFLTETGHYADARRQEWVLLADALGLTSALEDINSARPEGATPETGPGPFYRSDTPTLSENGSISRDGRGTPLVVIGRVRGVDGEVIPHAMVEVWQANGDGLYENQEPDLQPEHNLRGRLEADAQGVFRFHSVKPKGYDLPSDGPAGRLLKRLGLPVSRPAHINLRISAQGYQTLTTHIFDRADAGIDRDAIFAVRPALLADFVPGSTPDGKLIYSLDINLVLCPEGGAHPMPGRSS